jgi:RNA polymerase sigma-70 factor, ECF subfamily
LSTRSDAELVALTQQGDVGAFNQLASRWEASLYGFARRTLGDAEEARDVCQEALVKAYTNIGKLRQGEKFKSWVHYITLNLCRDRFRTARSKAEMLPYEEGRAEDLAGGDAPAVANIVPTDELTETGSRDRILAAILGEVPQEQRTAILLREFQGFTSEEIGEMTGVPAATVRTRIFYGLKAMRRVMKERGLDRTDFQ